MGRLVALDIGQKRIGVAVTDELKLIATPHSTVLVGDFFSFLSDYCKKESVDAFIVGEPRDWKNSPSESEKYIVPVLNRLKKEFSDIPVHRFDERFTSSIAFQAILDSGISKKRRRDKALIDKISAVLILQSYLEYQMK